VLALIPARHSCSCRSTLYDRVRRRRAADRGSAARAQIEHGPYGHEPIYGDGRAGERIADILSRNTVRIEKRITY
jgi:hypothetical protein